MAREFAGRFYQSNLWIRCKNSYIAERRAIDGGMCERCHEQPGYIVHHKVHLSPENINDQNVSLNFSNLEFVCHHCHDIIHGNCPREIDGLTKLRFDQNGQPIPV